MKHYPDKYRLNPAQSLFLAKKKWDENVYCGMKMENRAVTFPQTKTILDGVNVPNVQLDDIQAILNMRDAWRFLLGSINEAETLDYLCTLNGYIARNEALEWGKLRTGRVGISGTDYLPPIPEEGSCRRELDGILNTDATATSKALALFAWSTRGQFFWDGNKRTSLVFANKLMLRCGVGMLTVSESGMEPFNECLLSYYNTGDSEGLTDYLYAHSIQGIEWSDSPAEGISPEKLDKT